MSSPVSPFDHAAFCWASDLPAGRNQFVSFSLEFTRPSDPGRATLHVFADTRYRLYVNETFVAYGPGRFVTQRPEYDTHDLVRLLRAGTNTLRVEVNYYGCSSYQTMPDGQPGFIAAGGTADGAVSFATPGQWRTRIHQAWDQHAPHFSFAQNPAEILDTRRLAAELATPATAPAVALTAEVCPWPKPAPRSAPYPDYAPVRPARLLAAGPLKDALRWGVQIHRPAPLHAADAPPKLVQSYSTWIHSPREQTVTLEIFWSESQLNGRPVALTYAKTLGNHGQATVSLRSGWNFLTGHFELLLEYWSFLIGLPREAACTLHALPDLACTDTFALSAPSPAREILPFSDAIVAGSTPVGWTTRPSEIAKVTPARLTGWDSPAPDTVRRDVPFAQLASVATHVARSAVWCFDFADEYYGQTVIEVEAPAGSILDVAYDDWKRADGCVNLYHSNPFTEAADRFILRGGRQRIEVLNPRGGIFLQLILRVPAGADAAPLTVHDIAVLRRTHLTQRVGSFRSGDAVLDWAWEISTRTLQRSTDESYADCPWRERGSYIGDSFVNFHLNRLITADLSVARRTFAIFGQAQMSDSQLQCCAPSWLTKPHEDFSLIFVQCIHDYWAYTGDTDFVASQLPVIRRIFASTTWKTDADGLWDTTGKRLFIDWGVLPSEREGAANAVINILRLAALRCAATLADTLAHSDEAAGYRTQADQVSAALLTRVWDDSAGRFLASAGATTPAVHANILALRYGVGPADRILAYLEPLLRNNFAHGIEHGQFSGFAELYYYHFLLPALAKHGRADLAEALVQQTYGFIKELSYPTLTECFHRAKEACGSCCHSWSGAPAIYAIDYLLGLRLATPGNPNHYILDPVDSGRRQISGALPHPSGTIQVSWERKPNGQILAKVYSPEAVTITPGANVEILEFCPDLFRPR